MTATEYPLRQLYFYLTEGCNLACRHCWLAPKFDPRADRYPVLGVELFETAVREAKPLGLGAVKLTGGEPLMHPEIVRLLGIVRREELGLTVETNGVLCTGRMAAEIAKSENPFVSVSLDGVDAETHEWVRGLKGSFEQALEGIRNLVEAGIRPQFTITELARYGVSSAEPVSPDMPLALVDLPNGDDAPSYYLGAQNFFTITRYNRSSFYAMAVYELARSLAARRQVPEGSGS